MRPAAAVLALLQVPGLWASRAKVTIELKDIKAADHDEGEQVRKLANLKKALAD